MKSFGLFFSYFAASMQRRNLRFLVGLLAVFAALVAVFTVVFHLIMDYEDQSHSWATGVYWTLVTMTTLGFGDITFQSDLGRLFSVVVLLSGSLFLLVLLPFAFIQFVFTPWMAMREAARAPRQLPEDTSGHVILTMLGAIEETLIRRAVHAGVPYVVIAGALEEALQLHDRGYSVLFGEVDHPDTYASARVNNAALVVATRGDMANTNITFTVRELAPGVPIVATANDVAAIDNLELAGADKVLRLGDMLGESMADRALHPGRAHVIGRFAGLRIAEATTAGTDLVGSTLAAVRLREQTGTGVLGVWQRGRYTTALADTVLGESDLLLLAGTPEQLARYDAAHAPPPTEPAGTIIIGGGRVGRAAGALLAEAGVEYRIVEQRPERIRDPDTYVLGDASELDVLERAGIADAATVIVTTHDDDVNVYLSIYCRRLRDDLRIIARAIHDRNVSTLYRAGADSVLSYASIGATAIWNHLYPNDLVLLADGLSAFRRPTPPALAGRTLADSNLGRDTGCNLVGIRLDSEVIGNPEPSTVLPANGELVLIGDADAEARFSARYPPPRRRWSNPIRSRTR
ncbi:potassium channel family protein [Desertimonas flava]|uniref:potassium channel family protein n=1 Tax=Desertimonas flava TaxID=2064846 RepID=UPI000E345A24|nr:potassium channel protein [Desertimonas flava]